MKASVVEMEGLLRGKCVPAKMLVNESLAEYLVRQFDALHERADKAERERDELRLEITRIGGATAIEVLRRDAAAGECAGVVTGYAVNGYVVIGNKLSIGDHVYTAAPSAVLASEVEELSMLIRRLVHSLKNSNPHSGLLWSVPDFMHKKGYWKENDCLRGGND